MKRVLVIGASGFVGGEIKRQLELSGIEVLSITRSNFDLSENSSLERIASSILPSDSIVFAAARAPVRNMDDFIYNSLLVRNFVDCLQSTDFEYLLNISSDAVYPDMPTPIDEECRPSPGTLHGAMHLSREIALSQSFSQVGDLRPTLIYGAEDPHGGYGPNLFIRRALNNQSILLFGEGEELRDHIHVSDVAKLALHMLKDQVTGPINAVTGTVKSFYSIAEIVTKLIPGTKIEFLSRKGLVPHNGYREFKHLRTLSFLNDSPPLSLSEGLERSVGEIKHGRG